MTISLTLTFHTCHGVPDGILVPRQYWQSTARYDEAAHNLAVMFEENFEKKKYSHLPESVKAASPRFRCTPTPVIAAAACWDSDTSVAASPYPRTKGTSASGVLRANDSGYNTPDIAPFSGWGQRKRSCGGTVGL